MSGLNKNFIAGDWVAGSSEIENETHRILVNRPIRTGIANQLDTTGPRSSARMGSLWDRAQI